MKNKNNQTKHIDKDAIRADYAAGDITYRQLAEKYGINLSLVNRIMRPEKFEERKEKAREQRLLKKAGQPNFGATPKEITTLQNELRDARVTIKLLNAMIEISEKHYNIKIRKKAGIKRS